MLVLQRNVGERIILTGPQLASPITVKLTEIRQCSRGQRAVLGIEASESITILREELIPIPLHPPCSEPQETEAAIWFADERETAKSVRSTTTRAYIAQLEKIVHAADAYWMEMSGTTCDSQQLEASEALLKALAQVNFLAEYDTVEEEDAHAV